MVVRGKAWNGDCGRREYKLRVWREEVLEAEWRKPLGAEQAQGLRAQGLGPTCVQCLWPRMVMRM